MAVISDSKDVIRVLIVDDHAVVREAVHAYLVQDERIEVIAEESNADDALNIVMRMQPNVVVMDVDMPGRSPFDAVRTINSQWPQVRVIFLSAFIHDRYIEQAMQVQARGYLTKREPMKNLVEAIHKVAAGGIYFSDDVLSRIVIDGGNVRLSEKTSTRASLLSPREVEVLHYIASGMSKKEIASTMHISIKTVNRHTANLMEKLEIHDRVELSRFAIREGLAEA